MLAFALDVASVSVAAAILLAAVRLFIGPGMPDRILALDVLFMNAVAIAVLLGIRLDSLAYFDAAILVAMLGFVSTVALARYAARGEVFE